MVKTVFFRVDSSYGLGYGHINRCLILAEILQKNGFQIHFICKQLEGNLNNQIKKKGFFLHSFKNMKNSIEYDFKKTRKILTKFRNISCLVIDSYKWYDKYENPMKKIVSKIMIIDDYGNRKHDCDILLDQNLYYGKKHKYNSLIPKKSLRLIGPKYALLRKEFSMSKKKSEIFKLNKIFISFGGGGETNEVIKVLQALNNSKIKFKKINLIIGKKDINFKRICSIVNKLQNVKIFTTTKNISYLMENTDLGIGAAGSMTWERAYLGIPSIVSIISKNQELVAKSMQKKGCVYNVGWTKNTTNLNYEKILKKIQIQDLRLMSSKNKKLIDDKGASRVSKKLLSIINN